jgi:hypothetical protein
LKQYYFLVGLPRSGNTLLSSILNQNPKVSVTANSIVPDILWNLHCERENSLTFKNFPDHRSYNDLMSSIFDGYYKNWNSNIIIDRSNWGVPNNLKLLEKYCPNKPKFILLVRDILEVLASFIKWSRENKPNFIQNETNNAPVEIQCDFLMRSDLQIVQEYTAIHNLYKNPNALLITYNELIDSSEETMNKIYDFLQIEPHQHKFDNLTQLVANGVSYDDTVVGNNLHYVKSKISKTDYTVKDYLPLSVINKYGNLDFWKERS